MSHQPLISVIIPLYKSEEYLEATIASVLNQTYKNFELILVDDCSPDQTYALAQRLAQQDSRITVLKHDKNCGRPAFGRNTGIAAARGVYITFLDHDDSLEPTKLADSYETLTAQNVDFLVSNGFLYNESTKKVDGTAWAQVTGNVRQHFARRLLEGNFVPPNCTFMRAEVFKKVGVFDTSLSGVDDYDMWYRIARVVAAGVLEKPLATWRYNNAKSISADDSMMIEDEMKFYKKITENKLENIQAWEVTCAQNGISRCLKRLGHRALAAGDMDRAKKLYEEAGANRYSEFIAKAPRVLQAAYMAKRFLDRVRHRDFKPLVLQFGGEV